MYDVYEDSWFNVMDARSFNFGAKQISRFIFIYSLFKNDISLK